MAYLDTVDEEDSLSLCSDGQTESIQSDADDEHSQNSASPCITLTPDLKTGPFKYPLNIKTEPGATSQESGFSFSIKQECPSIQSIEIKREPVTVSVQVKQETGSVGINDGFGNVKVKQESQDDGFFSGFDAGSEEMEVCWWLSVYTAMCYLTQTLTSGVSG